MSSYTHLTTVKDSPFLQFTNNETGAAQLICMDAIERVGVNDEFCSIYLVGGSNIAVEPRWYLQVVDAWLSYYGN